MKTINKKYRKAQVPDRDAEVIPILHIIKSLGRGGAEMLLPETLSKHDKKKYQFHYIYFLPWKDQMADAIRKEGGTVSCFPAKNNAEILLKVWHIVRYVRRHNIRLIHCHMPWAGIIGRIVGKIRNVPVVYTEHNLWERYHMLTYHLNRLSFGLQNRVIAVSGDVAKSIRNNYHRSSPLLQVVMNGVNTDKFSKHSPVTRDVRRELGIAETAIVIGITCVFRAQKRLTTWLEVAALLHAKYPGTVFIIVGDGVLKNEIFQRAAMLQTAGYLHFTGLQTEIRPYLKAMDIFMMSSEFEGLPIALLEAMSMGCMPACTAAGGIPELIKDGENGILVPVEQPLELAERLADYISHPSLIQQMGVRARETVIEGFGMQQMVEELETIYHDLIK